MANDLEKITGYAPLYEEVGTTYIPTASICSRMIPKIEDELQGESVPGRVRLIGYNAKNLSDKYEHSTSFYESLRDWIAQGATVDYMFSDPSFELKDSDKLSELYEFANEQGGGRLNLYSLKSYAENSEGEVVNLKKYRTFHFVLTEEPNTIWIEHHHAVDRLYAQHCEFVSPVAIRESDFRAKTWDILSRKYEELIGYSVALPTGRDATLRELR